MKLRHMTLSLSLALATACSGGGGGNGTLEGDAGNPKTPGDKILQDLNNPVNSGDCIRPFVFVDNWGEELMQVVRMGDAACAKKVIELGKLDVNVQQKIFGSSKPQYPLWHALDSSSLFFAKGGSDDKSYQVIKVLVEAGARVDFKNDKNQSPLQYSLENDEIFERFPLVAAYLIQSTKTDLLERNKMGLAPYHYTLTRASIEHLKLALARGIDINFSSNSGKAPLLMAFESNFLDGINLLIANNIRIDFKDNGGNSSIQRAIQQNYDAVAMTLIGKGLDLNLTNNMQESALLTAIEAAKTDIAQELISKGADVDVRSSKTTALHLALGKNLSALVDTLLEKVKNKKEVDSSSETAVHLIIRHGSDAQLDRAITKQFPTDEKNSRGETPLHLATSADKVEMARSLLKSGAKSNSVDLEKRLVTHKVKSAEMLALVVDFKAPVNDLDSKGNSPLAYAALSNNRTLVEMFVQRKADTSWVDAKGRNLVSLMVGNNNMDLTQYFIDRGVSAAATDKAGNTPLFFAYSEEAVNFLANKVDVNALNAKKESALLKAVQDYISTDDKQSLQLVNALIDKNADIHVLSPDSKATLLHLLMAGRTPTSLIDGKPAQYLELSETVLLKNIKLNAKDLSGNTALHYADTVQEVELLGKYNAIANVQNKEGKTAKDKFAAKLKKLTKDLKLKEDALKLLEDEYDAAKAAGKTSLQTLLMTQINDAKAEMEGLTKGIDQNQKMVTAIEGIGG